MLKYVKIYNIRVKSQFNRNYKLNENTLHQKKPKKTDKIKNYV
jgi:hypothetical protein